MSTPRPSVSASTGLAKSRGIVDRVVGALGEAGGALLVAARGGDHQGAMELGELDRWQADAAGGPMNQYPIAGFEPAALQQRVVGGAVGAAKHRRLVEAEPGGDRVAVGGRGIRQLGEGAEPVPAHHPVADPEPGDTRPEGNDFAGTLAARHKRRLGPELVFAGQHQDIDILHAARQEPHLHFALTRRRRIGQLMPRQRLGPAKRLADHRPH
jgi:hypothetical protein